MQDNKSRYDKYVGSNLSKQKQDFSEDKDIIKKVPTEQESKEDYTINSQKTTNKDPQKKRSLKDKIKKHRLLIITALIIIVIIIVATVLTLGKKTTKTVGFTKNKPAVIKPIPVSNTNSNLVPSSLTGLMVNPSFNKLPVTGVMIENSLFARPQSGLSSAGVVFEALAEGGITRFLALYQDTQPNNVGPIRSARPYYVSWDLGFDAPYAHVGGSPEALNDITNWNVKDLNQFYNGDYYHRITSRAAPHNVYTAISTLNQLEANDGYNSSNFTTWLRKKDSPLKTPTAKTIDLYLSNTDYNVTYTYDSTSNSYLRDEGGAPQIDANTNKQISPKVVIAIAVPWQLEADNYHLMYQTIGSGTAYIFQDGGVTIGQWSKSSNNSQIMFTNSSDKEIALNAGQTWITAINNSSGVAYTP